MILRYSVLVIGNALYDPYFQHILQNTGDCTITLVYAQKSITDNSILLDSLLLIDPGFAPYNGVGKDLISKRWIEINDALQPLSLSPKDISWIHLTHNHIDHTFFKDRFLNLGAQLLKRPEGDLSSLKIVDTPGHSPDSKSILFLNQEKRRIAIVGDAIINESYFRANQVYLANGYTQEEIALTRRSMKKIAELTDIVIPGHGPEFKVNSG